MESVTLQGKCEIQFVNRVENRAWFGELKFEERISRVHDSVGKANLIDIHIGLSKVQTVIYYINFDL